MWSESWLYLKKSLYKNLIIYDSYTLFHTHKLMKVLHASEPCDIDIFNFYKWWLNEEILPREIHAVEE